MAGISRRFTVVGLLVLALSTAWAEPAAAQAALLGPGAGFVSAGASSISTGELDARLTAHGYPSFGRTTFAVSIGAYRILPSSVMLGAEWHGLVMGEEAHEGGEVGLGGGYGTLGVGYSVQLSTRARVYPRVGIGAGGLGMWIEKEPDTVGFDEVLADPSPAPDLRETVLSRDGLVVDLGGGVELLPSGRGGGLLIGLRLGYLAAPFDAPWDHLHERKASGGPDATISGPYFRVVIGGAWRR